MQAKIIDGRNREAAARRAVEKFYQACGGANCMVQYSFFATEFQKRVPLNYFLVHSRYDIDLGTLRELQRVEVDREKGTAVVDALVETGGRAESVRFYLKLDFGGWKIKGEYLYPN